MSSKLTKEAFICFNQISVLRHNGRRSNWRGYPLAKRQQIIRIHHKAMQRWKRRQNKWGMPGFEKGIGNEEPDAM